MTPQSLEHIKALLEAGADAFVIGEQQFGLRLAGSFLLKKWKKQRNLFTQQVKGVCCSQCPFP